MTTTRDFDYDPDVTMREMYRRAGFDPDELVHPKNVTPEDIGDSEVVVFTTVQSLDPDAPRTTRGFVEWEIGPGDVFATEDVAEATDGVVSYPEDTPIEHAVRWGYQMDIPQFQSIGFGDSFYGDDPKFDDPHSWDRTAGNVVSVSDDFIRFRL